LVMPCRCRAACLGCCCCGSTTNNAANVHATPTIGQVLPLSCTHDTSADSVYVLGRPCRISAAVAY
jgi:hypothetical protein